MGDSFNIEGFIRENIAKLQPYSSARDEYSGSASVFLDANENPLNAPLNRYPDPKQLELKRIISDLKGLPSDSIFLGNGSDEGIDLLFRVLCEPGRDNVITVDPTYGMYGVCAQINDVERKSVLLRKDFSLDPTAVLEAVDEHTKLIFLCSPNNPTSNVLQREAMLQILEQAACLVVIDEAYLDFSEQPGMLSELPAYGNLVILQTLSKAWGMAGIRLGMVFAHPELIAYLSAVKYPYNLNTLSIEAAKQQLTEVDTHAFWVATILKERKALASRLGTFNFVEKVFPSDANFLLIRVKNPGQIYTFLMKQGIIVRDRSSVALCEGCLRITVGTSAENQLLIEALTSYADMHQTN
jgi:histidinol-phosphate aminotransferase